MDLTKYTNSKTNKTKNKKTILDNNDITIIQIGDEIEFEIKTKKGLEKYKEFLFMSTTDYIITDDNKKAENFFQKSIEKGVEGLMFKNLNSSYTPGLRTGNMTKLKENKEDLDVVILAAEHGTGKRAGFYSSFYIGVKNNNYNEEKDKYLTVGKVSSGIKEIGETGHSMENLKRLLSKLKIKEEKGVTYFKPKIIIQIKYQEIQRSTIYDSGFALRFPRIIMLREDKTLEEINSIKDIETLI